MGQQESIERAYQVVREKTVPKIEEAIKAKEAELDEMLTGFLGLSPKLQARANEKMEALQEEIDRLRGNLQDLLVPLSDLHEELAARRDAFDRALAEMRRDSGGRKKSAALSEAVEKIVLRFRHTEPKRRAKGKRKYNGKSYLDSVEIVPISADQTIVTMEAARGRG
jgi:predicted  nucleic acid-binding Zn-ribbon protein